jgi:hypothetical protein
MGNTPAVNAMDCNLGRWTIVGLCNYRDTVDTFENKAFNSRAMRPSHQFPSLKRAEGLIIGGVMSIAARSKRPHGDWLDHAQLNVRVNKVYSPNRSLQTIVLTIYYFCYLANHRPLSDLGLGLAPRKSKKKGPAKPEWPRGKENIKTVHGR